MAGPAAYAPQPGRRGKEGVGQKGGRIHAIWHQLYNSPYHFAALQQLAKWLYPEEFQDLDPERALREFHQKFLPIEYTGAFWGSLRK